MNQRVETKLLAIVSVDHADRVRCGQPTCGHSVYRRIHVVQEGKELMVLGSTCFAKRYGNVEALGAPHFGGAGGRLLTKDERELLLNNTALLLAQFEQERVKAITLAAIVVPAVPEVRSNPLPHTAPWRLVTAAKAAPWAWMKPTTSMAYFKLKDGTGWVRVQRNDGKQLLAPWPAFEGWDEALPSSIGSVDSDCGAYVLNDVVAALKYLRSLGEWELITGIWREITAAIAKQASQNGVPALK